MGNSCFKGEESDGENNYLAGGSSGARSSNSRSQPVDREVLAAAAEKRLKANNERGIKTHTVQQRAKAELPEFGEAPMKWQNLLEILKSHRFQYTSLIHRKLSRSVLVHKFIYAKERPFC